MRNKTQIALAVALILGTASVALAGDQGEDRGGYPVQTVPSGKWLEFGVARYPGNMKVSFQAARSIG
jgi:hypothetical protein